MIYQHRTYQEKSKNFDTMCELVSYLNGLHLCDWSLGRLYEWKYGRWSKESQNDSLFEKQAELFFDSVGELCEFSLLKISEITTTFFQRKIRN